MVAGGLSGPEAISFKNLGLNLPGEPLINPRVSHPLHTVKTSSCFEGISQQILDQE